MTGCRVLVGSPAMRLHKKQPRAVAEPGVRISIPPLCRRPRRMATFVMPGPQSSICKWLPGSLWQWRDPCGRQASGQQIQAGREAGAGSPSSVLLGWREPQHGDRCDMARQGEGCTASTPVASQLRSRDKNIWSIPLGQPSSSSVLEGVASFLCLLLLCSQGVPVHLLQWVVHIVPVEVPVPLCPGAQEQGHVDGRADQQQENQDEGKCQPRSPGERGQLSCPRCGLS